MKTQALCTLFAMLSLAGCSQPVTKGSDQVPGKLTTQSTLIITGPGGGDTFPMNPATISAMRIEGDMLRLTVTHSGGCKDHTYQLYTSGAVMKSYPPQMTLHLAHNAHGDACRALITQDLTFDLSPLKQHLGGISGTVILRVHEPGAANFTEPMLTYRY